MLLAKPHVSFDYQFGRPASAATFCATMRAQYRNQQIHKGLRDLGGVDSAAAVESQFPRTPFISPWTGQKEYRTENTAR
jgi:hypothetical protein